MAKTHIGVFAATIAATSLIVAVPAHADNSSDFLSMVSGEGLNVGDTPADVELTLAKGDQICHLIHIGYTPEVAGRQVKYAFPNATAQQIAGFVDAAQAKLCPQSFEIPLQPGG